MRPPIIALAGLFLSATLLGCGGAAAIPQPPAQATTGPPPGTSPEMANTTKKAATGGVMAPVNPYK
jgi:hypothetical protein